MNHQPVCLELLPDLLDAVLDAVMPTGPMWREVFTAEPGLEVEPADDGWIVVRHRGVDVCQLEASLLHPDGGTGRVRFTVDGHPAEAHLGRDGSS